MISMQSLDSDTVTNKYTDLSRLFQNPHERSLHLRERLSMETIASIRNEICACPAHCMPIPVTQIIHVIDAKSTALRAFLSLLCSGELWVAVVRESGGFELLCVC